MAFVIKSADVNPTVVSELAQRRTVSGKNLMITCYEAKAGAEFEAHSHPEEQMGFVVKGRIEFFVGDQEERIEMEAGTFFHFASNERHRSRVLEDLINIDVFAPPRPEYVGEAATGNPKPE
jgi:quercetin dioxygenase-like cupin family protein